MGCKNYVNHASFVAIHGNPVLDLLDPKEGEKILDLGRGDGASTFRIAKAGVIVHGVDSSSNMIRSAIDRGFCAEVGSGDFLAFTNEFDAVFLNAALHWMTDYESTIAGVYSALKSKGRFVGEFGGEGNVFALVKAMSKVFSDNEEFGNFNNPWFFPSAKFYKEELEKGGFNVDYIELIPRPTPLSSGVGEWLRIFANGIASHLRDAQKGSFLKEVEVLVKPSLYKGREWVADYVRLRFSAVKA